MKLWLICVFFACSLICASCSGEGLIQSEHPRHRNSKAGSAAAHITEPASLQPACHSRDQSLSEITPFSSRLVSLFALPYFSTSLFLPCLRFVSGMRCAYTCVAQRRWVHDPPRESKSLSSIMYGVSSVPHLQLSHFWLQDPTCAHTLLVKE